MLFFLGILYATNAYIVFEKSACLTYPEMNYLEIFVLLHALNEWDTRWPNG